MNIIVIFQNRSHHLVIVETGCDVGTVVVLVVPLPGEQAVTAQHSGRQGESGYHLSQVQSPYSLYAQLCQL